MEDPSFSPHGHREGYKIIQIHPTLNCNLQCIHCYSDSAPGLKGGLDISALKLFLMSAMDEGYNTLAISGGEPFMYRELKELLKFSKEHGYYNSVTTNGGLLGSAGNQEILQYINLVAVSLDGKKEKHNYIRNNPAAFDQLLKALEILKNHQGRFGFIHLLHNEPLDTLKWLCEFALEHKARLLHLHPMESAGRGKPIFNALELTDDLRHKMFILYHFYKQKHRDDFDMQLDLLHRDIVLEYPQLVYQFGCDDICDTNYYRELIIDEDGYVLPVSHGFPRHLALGNIYEKLSLTEMITRYHAGKLQQLKHIYSRVYENIVADEENLLFNYPELVMREGESVELEVV
jgi:Fe-coproporphyrin III synthase